MDQHSPNITSGNNLKIETSPVPVTATPPLPWQHLRRFFACNPFYLLSSALLLYSFYLVSADQSFLSTEVSQLSFNLGSLQLYEILLVATAIFLARRTIWYDSTLLVGLENLLLLVPFILISQAALIDSGLVWGLCIVAGLLAASRQGFLKRYISRLNFPKRLVWVGLFVLVANAALPIVYRLLHESKFGTKPDWGAAYQTNQYVWWVLMPFLCALISMIPWARAEAAELWPQRRWLPLGLFSLWLVGTGVHLYCLGYVYDFGLRPELLAPAVWTLVWVAWLKIDRMPVRLDQNWKDSLWVPPVLATLLATAQPEKVVFLALSLLNTSIFAWLYSRRRIPLALHLAFISVAAMVGGLPEDWGRTMVTQFHRETFVAAAAAGYLLVCVALSRDLRLGILGAIVVAISLGNYLQAPASVHWAIQAGLVFLLMHSLRWADSEVQGAGVLRWAAAVAWVAHSIAWTHAYSAGWRGCLIAIPVLVAWFIFRRLSGKGGSLAIPVAALLVLLSAPGQVATTQLQSTPTGLLAVIGSFVLFGLGTLAAITKHHWTSNDHSEGQFRDLRP